jgi:acyl-CoA thioesterase-1
MRAVLLVLAGLLLPGPAVAADTPPAQCDAPDALLGLGAPLPRLAARLARQEAVTVVALGSSSTGGAGASRPALAYPARLAAYWPQLVGGGPVTIHNRGINGQEVLEMNRRLKADAVELRPDLVLWQLGTNAVLRSEGVEIYRAHIRDGLATLRAAGIDVVLIDLQHAPRVLRDPDHPAMQVILADLARETGAGLFRRFDLMRHWQGRNGLGLTDPDELHMNDLGYACWARALALALHRAAAPDDTLKTSVSGKN